MYTYYIVARLLRAFALFSGVEIYSHTAIIRFGVGRDDSDTSEIIPPASKHGHGKGDRRIRLRKNILARAIKEARLGHGVQSIPGIISGVCLQPEKFSVRIQRSRSECSE